MNLSHEDMTALSCLNVEELPVTDNQKQALEKLTQAIRAFLATVQDSEPTGFKPLEVVKCTQ